MTNPANASQQYLKNAVLTAPPEQLHLMLVDGAIRFATRGKEAIERKDIESAFKALERAQRIVLELSNGLRREVNPELVDQMAALHAFVYRRLVDGSVRHDPQAVAEALRILRHHRETWVMLMEKLSANTPGPGTPEVVRPAAGERRESALHVKG
jgi:flagellar protein FliS